MRHKLSALIKNQNLKIKSFPLSAALIVSVFFIGANYGGFNLKDTSTRLDKTELSDEQKLEYLALSHNEIISHYNEKKAAYSQNKVNLAMSKNTLQQAQFALSNNPDNQTLKEDINKTMRSLEQAYHQMEVARKEADTALQAVIKMRSERKYLIETSAIQR